MQNVKLLCAIKRSVAEAKGTDVGSVRVTPKLWGAWKESLTKSISTKVAFWSVPRSNVPSFSEDKSLASFVEDPDSWDALPPGFNHHNRELHLISKPCKHTHK